MTPRTEHGIVITAPEKAELQPIDVDTGPLGPKEVAGHTLATVISAGTELAWNYTGKQFPTRPGYAAVFRVEAAGAEVTDVKTGDVVFCMGRHQSYQRMTRPNVVPVPKGLSPDVAVFARMMGISMSTLTTTTARPPGKVLVTGLGLVGHLAAQIFAGCGYDVIACDPIAARREIAERMGLRALPAVPVDDATLAGQIDLVVECSGHEQAVLDGCKVVRKRGEVVLVGVPWRRMADMQAFDLLHAVFHKYVVLRSGWEWEVPHQPTDFVTGSLFGQYAGALRWLGEGRVKVEGLYQKTPPRDCQKAYQSLLHKTAEKLAIVFDWTQPSAE
jgi:threonine dehydrogenase-like Zn-dependent dehydrogenase